MAAHGQPRSPSDEGRRVNETKSAKTKRKNRKSNDVKSIQPSLECSYFTLLRSRRLLGGLLVVVKVIRRGYQRGIISTDILGDRLLSYFHICFTKEHDVETNDVSA